MIVSWFASVMYLAEFRWYAIYVIGCCIVGVCVVPSIVRVEEFEVVDAMFPSIEIAKRVGSVVGIGMERSDVGMDVS